jgi:regulator of sigma E protease
MGSNLITAISAFTSGNYTYWIIPFLFVLTIIVLFHELGHYLVARFCGIRVTVFSLGFGRELIGFDDRHGTRWKISAIPLGGYVKFYGDENAASVPDPATLAAMTDEERRRSFPGQPVGNRAAVAAAGPIVNFILAIAIFAGVAMVYGKITATPRIGGVEPDSAAAAAGIKAGDLVVSIEGTRVESFDDVAQIIGSNPGVPLTIVVDRGGALTTLTATPAERDHRGKLGIRSSNDPGDVVARSVTPLEAAQLGAERTWLIISSTLGAIRDIVLLKQSADVIGGPIMIADLAGKVAQRGFDQLLTLTAVLSASVGLFNLFPIPILDGGHLLFCLVEAVQGRPLSERALEVSFRIGLATILMLMIFVIGNDLVRLAHSLFS